MPPYTSHNNAITLIYLRNDQCSQMFAEPFNIPVSRSWRYYQISWCVHGPGKQWLALLLGTICIVNQSHTHKTLCGGLQNPNMSSRALTAFSPLYLHLIRASVQSLLPDKLRLNEVRYYNSSRQFLSRTFILRQVTATAESWLGLGYSGVIWKHSVERISYINARLDTVQTPDTCCTPNNKSTEQHYLSSSRSWSGYPHRPSAANWDDQSLNSGS